MAGRVSPSLVCRFAFALGLGLLAFVRADAPIRAEQGKGEPVPNHPKGKA